MKLLINKLIRGGLSLRAMAVGTLLLGGSVLAGYAGSADPSAGSSFTWDLTSSGAGQRGIALLTFSNDFTFHGYLMGAPVPNTNTLARGGTASRSGTTLGGTTNTFVFGFTPVNGIWAIDSKGQISGFYSEALNVTSVVTNYNASSTFAVLINSQTSETTNLFVSFTNGQANVTTNFAWQNPPGYTQIYVIQNTNFTIGVGSAESTNAVSFRGTSTFQKRLTLICSTSFGKAIFNGVPAVQGIDLSGFWIGTKRDNGLQSTEFFTLVSSTVANPFPAEFPDAANFPNIFFTSDGVGPGYTFSGVVMISRQRNVGFTFFQDNGIMTSTVGSLRPSSTGPVANTRGIGDPLDRVDFKAALQ